MTDPELAKLELNHILTGRKDKDSWKQFCVGLHLQKGKLEMLH